MGVVCSKVCVAVYGDGDLLPGRRNQVIASCNWQKHFTVDVECYCVPADRVSTRDINTLGPGSGCRSVVVTTVNIERRVVDMPRQRLKALNSVVYTPVLQWFGIDIREQVPKFLPMNLWPGSYTVFGFYKPEEAGAAYVSLTARIGPEDLCIEETMNTKKNLSAEQWSNLSRCLEKELAKFPSRTLSVAEQIITVEEKVGDEERRQRPSQDTGYMSRKITPIQSPFSVRYTDQTSDSEDGGGKEKQSKEKRMRMKRKDTPASNIHPFPFSASFKDSKHRLRESPLAEEADIPNSPVKAVSTRRSFSSFNFESISDVQTRDDSNINILSTPGVLKASKSCQDITDILPPEHPRDSTTPDPEGQSTGPKSPAVTRKKKRSIASKIGDKTIHVRQGSREDNKHNYSDMGSEADDEEESSFTDSDKRSKQIAATNEEHVEDETSILSHCNITEYIASEKQYLDKDADRQEDVKDDIETEHDKEGKSDSILIKTKEGNTVTDKFKDILSRKEIMSNSDIEQAKIEKKLDSDPIKVSFDTKTAELIKEIVNRDSQTDIGDLKVPQQQPMERTKTMEHTEVKHSVVRTLSSARVGRRSSSKDSFKDKSQHEDESHRRTHKSVSYPSKTEFTSRRKAHSIDKKGKLDVQPTPPLRIKEAFSDTN